MDNDDSLDFQIIQEFKKLNPEQKVEFLLSIPSLLAEYDEIRKEKQR